jgi:hypothetical protein
MVSQKSFSQQNGQARDDCRQGNGEQDNWNHVLSVNLLSGSSLRSFNRPRTNKLKNI